MADGVVVNDAARRTYAGMFVLKLLDLQPEDGGTELDVILPHDLEPFDPVLESLAVEGHVDIDRKKGRYELTVVGENYLGTLIDEAEGYIDEFDGWAPEAIVREVGSRNLDPMRVRFLWGWYHGEFDDPVLWQQRRGFFDVEFDWAAFVLGEAFYADLAKDLKA